MELVQIETKLSNIDEYPTIDSSNLIDSNAVAIHGSAFDISEYNKVGETLTTYADLSNALGTDGANIPEDARHGGMTVKFVQSSDNKYVQYRLMATSFSITESDWQGVDDEPTAGSENLAKSGSVYLIKEQLEENINPNGYEIEESELASGIIATTDGYARNGNWNTYYFRVKQGYNYKIVSDDGSSCRSGFSTAIPANGVSISGYTTISQVKNISFESSIDGYFGVSIDKSIVIGLKRIFPKCLAKDIEDLEASIENTYATKAELASEISNVNGDIADAEFEINGIKSDISFDKLIQLTQAKKENFIPTDSVYARNDNLETRYVKCTQGDKLRMIVPESGSYYTGFSPNVPNLGDSVTDFVNYNGPRDIINATIITAPITGYFAVGVGKSAAAISFYKINEGIGVLVGNLVVGRDMDIEFPDYIFAINNAAEPLNNRVQSVKLEGMINQRESVTLNGNHREVMVSPKESVKKIVVASEVETLDSKDDISVISTPTSVVENKNIRLLCIGDSWAAAALKNLEGEENGPAGYPTCALNNYKKICIDNGYSIDGMMLLGLSNRGQRNVSYKNESYTLRRIDCGYGGYSSQNIVRHPEMIGSYNGQLYGKAAWDAIGLGRKIVYGNPYDESQPYTEFTNSAAQILEYLTTAMGYYHWDYSTELMNWCGISGTYSGTTEQKNAIDSYMVNLLENPHNPFFDWDVAISTNGVYAFSFSKFIERYKTLQDDGVTRLVVGDTAGTKINSSNINTIDVCTPTHVTIELGVNDARIGLTPQQRVNDILHIANNILSYNSNIKVGICQVHIPGAFFPEYWDKAVYNAITDIYVLGFFTNNSGLYALNKAIKSNYSTPSKTGICYVPTYYVMSPTRAVAEYGVDNIGNKVIIDGNDILHPSIDVHEEIGYQVLSWILYTLS